MATKKKTAKKKAVDKKQDVKEKSSIKENVRSMFKESAKINTFIMVMMVLLDVFLAIIQLFSRTSMFVPILLLTSVSGLWMLFAKSVFPEGYPSDKEEKRQMCYVNLFIVACVALIYSISNDLVMGTIGTLNAGVGFFMSIFVLLAYIIFGLMFIVPSGLTFKVSLAKYNIYEGRQDKNKENSGDIVIGEILDKDVVIDKDGHHKKTGEKLIIPYGDRFVHMAVFGPTGSGKTSQILGPMSLQDVKNKDMGIFILEPKGDFDEVVYARAKLYGREHVQYFNPVLPNCPYFNPLKGDETEVMENLVTAFAAMGSAKTNVYFKNLDEMLLRNSIKTVKRLYGDDATFNHITDLMYNVGGKGVTMVEELKKKPFDEVTMNENNVIYNYFKNDYFTGMKGSKNMTKTYQDSSNIRTTISKLTSNKYLAKVLIPPKTSELKEGEYIDFDKSLERGDVVCMSSAQGALRDMGTYLGYFLILSLQSSIFRRPGTPDSRRGAVLYIDEAQKYANKSMEDLLTQGRSYRVACVFATQNRALLNSGGEDGQRFLDNVSTNMRSVIVFPGASSVDAKYFSAEFGTEKKIKHKESYSNRAYVPKFVGFDSARVTVSDEEVDEPVFSPSDMQRGAFGEVKIKYISHMNIRNPELIGINWVDRKVDQAAQKYLDEIMNGSTLDELEKMAAKETDRVDKEVKEIEDLFGLDEPVDDENYIDMGFGEESPRESQRGTTSTNSDEEDYPRAVPVDDAHDDVTQEDTNQEFEDEEEISFDEEELEDDTY